MSEEQTKEQAPPEVTSQAKPVSGTSIPGTTTLDPQDYLEANQATALLSVLSALCA